MAVISKALALAALCMVALSSARPHGHHGYHHGEGIEHVLYITIDGFHQVDLANWIASNPHSNIGKLVPNAVMYTNAQTSKPSDSFPGLTNPTTGCTPATHGIWYDDSYDRTLYPPHSDCKGPIGTEVLFDETIDYNLTMLNGGGGINPANLPLRLVGGKCKPVYPHQHIRVNTIFEVAHEAGLGTAWTDKHPAYDLLNGPSGKGIDDLYCPEIASIAAATNVTQIEAYDDLHRDAMIAWAKGRKVSGAKWTPPAIFGGDFQAVSVAEKTYGYLDAKGTPSAWLKHAITHTDESIGKIVAAMKQSGIYEKTLFILSAIHGQSPIDPKLVSKKPSSVLTNAIGVPAAQITSDDIGLIWLKNPSDAYTAASNLYKNHVQAGAAIVWAGAGVKLAGFGDPSVDPRVPDVIVQSTPGLIYTTGTKIAEHGGLYKDDNHVALLVHNPRIKGAVVELPVTTSQIAPTVLLALGLDPMKLQGVQIEGTLPLPYL